MFEALTIAGGSEIRAENDGYMNTGFWGSEAIVFDVDDKFEIEVASANLVKVKSGTCSVQGRLGQIRPGNTEEIVIESGTPGVTRTDLIVFEVSKTGDTETFEIKALKGSESTGIPVPLEKQNIYSGGTVYQAEIGRAQVTTTGITVLQDYQDLKIQSSLTNFVEAGENEFGSYEKWSDGRLICEGSLTFESGGEEGNITKVQQFPYPFIAEPRAVGSFSSARPDLFDLSIRPNSATEITVTIYRGTTSATVAVDYIARGKWK